MHEENFEDPSLFFGDEAREGFWDLYKSERRFKDYKLGTDDIKDPRFAYLQTCKELKVHPKARLLIRDKKTSHLDYSNLILLNKSAVAVAEAIKRYTLPVESITISNNGLKPKECQLLIESFTRHYQMISSLTISKNKLGIEGAKYLSGSLSEMKILSKLVLADDEIGDAGVSELIYNCRNYCSLEYLDISGNNLGKSSAALEFADNMNAYLTNNQYLEVLKMNWNSLRDEIAEKVIEGLIDALSIKEFHISNNLIGVSYNERQPPGKGPDSADKQKKAPPVNKMAELLQKSKNL